MGQGAGRALRAAGARLGQVLGEVRAHEVEERGLLARASSTGPPAAAALACSQRPLHLTDPALGHLSRYRILMAFMSAHTGVSARTMVRGECC